MSALRVEFFFDDEASNWHFRVPALHINGGGVATRADAEREERLVHRDWHSDRFAHVGQIRHVPAGDVLGHGTPFRTIM